MTASSEYDVSSITWHQWHHTAEIESRIGLSSRRARSNASCPHSSQPISCARFGRGAKCMSTIQTPLLLFVAETARKRGHVKDEDQLIHTEQRNGRYAVHEVCGDKYGGEH